LQREGSEFIKPLLERIEPVLLYRDIGVRPNQKEMIMKGISNKRVLITGATQGIGRAVAERFLEEGASVLLTDAVSDTVINDTVDALKDRFPGLAFGKRVDITDEKQIIAGFAYMKDALGGCDILINNAGINRRHPSHLFTSSDFDQVLAVNLRGAFLCSREALKLFVGQGSGIILNNSSNHEMIPKPEFLAYSVSKGGLGNLTRTLALEYSDRGIRVNAVAPGATITAINASWKDDPVMRKQVESHIPLGRSASPEEIAGVFAFLASDDAAYITGQTLYVDGGLNLHTDFKNNWSS
jgi:glucose 1-dehydrogenase